MDLDVKLLRARVWLSQRALGVQDGFLAVTRAAKRLEKLTCGSLDAPTERSKRKFESATLKWSEPTAASTASVLRVAHAERAPPRIEFLLFMLQASPERQQQNQRVAFIGRSALCLRAEDVDALRSQHEIVFSTALDGGLGSLDVKVSTRSTNAQHATDDDTDEERGGGGAGGFSVNWSSSEALQRDLAEKARLQAESEAKLLLQLRKVVARALHAVDVRDEALRNRRLWWSAVRIQRAFRALLRRQQEQRERAHREQLAQQEARKACARTAVVERNLRRAQTMREQLLSRAARGSAASGVGHVDRIEHARELAESVRAQAETRERERLRHTLATIDGQRRVASPVATSECASTSAATAARSVDAELVRAIRVLHFDSNTNF